MDKRIQIISFFILIFIDQLTKFYFFKSNQSVLNVGISFGLGVEYSQRFWTILLTVLVFFLAMILVKSNWPFWPLFLAGAVSNLLDRLFLGGVRDFLPLPFTNLYNNLADYYITVAILLYAYKNFISRPRHHTH